MGRPKGIYGTSTEFGIKLRQAITSKAWELRDKLLDAKADLALGHYVFIEKDGKLVKMYKKSPDGDSIEWFIEMAAGRPQQNVDVKSDGKPIGYISQILDRLENGTESNTKSDAG